MPVLVLGTWDSPVHNGDKNPCPGAAYILAQETDSKQLSMINVEDSKQVLEENGTGSWGSGVPEWEMVESVIFK